MTEMTITEEEKYFLLMEVQFELEKKEAELIEKMNTFNEEMNTINEEYIINELHNKELCLY